MDDWLSWLQDRGHVTSENIGYGKNGDGSWVMVAKDLGMMVFVGQGNAKPPEQASSSRGPLVRPQVGCKTGRNGLQLPRSWDTGRFLGRSMSSAPSLAAGDLSQAWMVRG